MRVRTGGQSPATVRVVEDGRARMRSDVLAAEEPLEIRLALPEGNSTLGVTMRTPGADFELAAGLLYAEGVVSDRDDIAEIRYCTDVDVPSEQRYNVVTVHLASGSGVDLRLVERHTYTTSACGVCGKASVDALRLAGHASLPRGPLLDPQVLYGLPSLMRDAQENFSTTGGLHAAGLFDPRGNLIAIREDVGRHNALDKLVGWALLEARLPLREHIILVSGRASFELAQKAVRAGAPVLCAVSAPSSLAVDVGRAFGLTLVGFLRGRRFNVYTGEWRIGSGG